MMNPELTCDEAQILHDYHRDGAVANGRYMRNCWQQARTADPDTTNRFWDDGGDPTPGELMTPTGWRNRAYAFRLRRRAHWDRAKQFRPDGT